MRAQMHPFSPLGFSPSCLACDRPSGEHAFWWTRLWATIARRALHAEGA